MWRDLGASNTSILCLLLVAAFTGHQIGLNRNLQLPQHRLPPAATADRDVQKSNDTAIHRLARIASMARSTQSTRQNSPTAVESFSITISHAQAGRP